MRVRDALPWAAWAALAGAELTTSLEFQTARAAGLGPLCAGVVAAAADLKALGDLSAVYGREKALWASVAVSATTGTAALVVHGHTTPVVLSVAFAVGAHALTTRTEQTEEDK